MKLDNRGQMRVVEAMIACVILIVGLSATTYFSNVFTTEEGGDLEEVGQNVLHVLDNTDLIKQIIQNEDNWESKLKFLIETLLPPDTSYSLTLVSGLTGHPIAAITNMMGQGSPSSLNAVSLQRIITISLPLTRIEQKELDVMLVIDRSGSMNQPYRGKTKITWTQEAAKAFVSQLDATKDRVGLASFATEATLDINLTNNFQQVNSAIDSLTAEGERNMGDGIGKANQELASDGRSGSTWVMILLSGGVANRPLYNGNENETYAREYALSQAEIAAGLGVVIYTIGLGDPRYLDEGLLKEIQTNGYYPAPSPEDLMDIYTAIAEDLLFAVKYDIVIIKLTLVKAK